MKTHARGFGLIELLAAMAAAAVLVAILATLYEKMTRLRVEAEVNQDVESLMHYLQDGLNNPAVCRSAFRTNPGTAAAPPPISGPGQFQVSWNPPAQAQVGHIQLANGTATVMGAYVNQVLQGSAAMPRVQISRIFLREPNPALNEGNPVRSRITQGGIDYNVVAAKVVLQFQVSPLVMPQGLPDRTLDVVVGLVPGSGLINLCYQNKSDPTVNFQTFCSPGNLSGPDCPLPSTGCQKFYFVHAFDAASKPLCACEIICATPPTGPPGTYKSFNPKAGN